MTQNTAHFEEFSPHTRLKHAILDSYIVAWGMKLLMGGAGPELAIVDAFAGRGRDGAGKPGSPVIAAKRALEVMEATRKPGLNPRVHVFAIEESPTKYRALSEAMSPYQERHPDLIHLYQGHLADFINEILGVVRSSPTFYFLDPFGIKGLDASTYKKALLGPRNEIFALFADIGANRLHGLITAPKASASDRIDEIRMRLPLFPELDEVEIAEAEIAAAQSNKALDASIPPSREHLSNALGNDEWVDQILATAQRERPDAFLRLFGQALIRAGAQHVLPIPMRNEKGNRVYSLVHASKSPAGFVTMKESVTTGLGKSQLPSEVVDRMRGDLSVDIPKLVTALRDALAGQTIRWADDGGLKEKLLSGTALFNFQCNDLKKALKEAGILHRRDQKEVCTFPSKAD